MNGSVLIAGESWMTHSIHVKGFDSFTTSTYEEGVGPLRAALEAGGFTVDYQPSHVAMRAFPATAGELSRYGVVILSDIGANTLLLHPDTFARSAPLPNRLEAVRDYVLGGGGLLMVGGYLSFQGIEAKAAYRGTPVEEVLPVLLEAGDDRVEQPQGAAPTVIAGSHPTVRGLPAQWPPILGLNRVGVKSGSLEVVRCSGSPLLVVGTAGKGRSGALTTDCGPHWAPPPFVQWEYYRPLWCQVVTWLAGGS